MKIIISHKILILSSGILSFLKKKEGMWLWKTRGARRNILVMFKGEIHSPVVWGHIAMLAGKEQDSLIQLIVYKT